MRDPLVPKSDFVGLDDVAYLYTGAEGPLLKAGARAITRYVAAKSEGEPGREKHRGVEESCRQLLADLVGGVPQDLALVSNASEAISLVVNALHWQPGDNVVTTDLEYPSLVFSLLRLRPFGIEVRVVRSKRWRISAEDFEAHVDDRTRLVGTSHVSYLSGYRFDVSTITDVAHRHGAILLLDATQSLGVVPIPTEAADVVVSSSYKWLLAPHGVGILRLAADVGRALQPSSIGWRSVPDIFTVNRFNQYVTHDGARKFEVGFPNFAALYALETSLRYLASTTIQAIEEHVLDLGTLLIAGLRDRGWNVLTPVEPSLRAGNIAFASRSPERVRRLLAENGVLVWAGDGRVRASIHLFNGERDVRRLLAVLGRRRPRVNAIDEGEAAR